MRRKIRPTGWLTFLLAPLLLLGNVDALADSHEPPQTGVLESFLCTYVDGKDRDDLDSATEFYQRQAGKAGVGTPDAYLWTKLKGTSEAQLIWHNVYDDLAAFGAQMDAEAASSEMAAVTERYDTVVSCAPMLANVMAVHQRGESNGGEGRFAVSYACSTRMAPNQAAFGDLNTHIGDVLGGMGDAAPLATYALGMITTDPSGPNAVYFNVFDDVTHWTSFQTQLNGTGAGQMLVRHFTTMLNCSTNMWGAEQVISNDEE